MNFETFTDLVGHSILHPDVKAAIKPFNYKGPAVVEKGPYGVLEKPRLYDKQSGIEFEFTTRIACGDDLKSSFTDEKYELIVKSVGFWKLIKNNSYPFSLKAGDDDKTVAAKLNNKPYKKGKSSSKGFVYWYYKDNFEVIIHLNDKKNLKGFSVQLQDIFAKKNARLQAASKEQQNHITTEHLKDLRALNKNLPTAAWRKRMKEEKNIKAAETALKEFIADLELATQKKKAAQVQAAIKKTVNKFNKLNSKKDSFIETLEREELADFITRAVRLTGFRIEKGADITEAWRQW